MFPLILVTIRQILMKWQQSFEIQDGGGLHLELWLLKIFRCHRCLLNQSNNIPSKFDDDRSISNEMTTVFRNPRLRLPTSLIF